MIIVALASMPLSPPFSAFAQRERGPLRSEQPRLEERRLEERTPLRPQTFGGHLYRGRLAWGHGRWRHEVRKGRDGWWWHVGGVWYFYPEPFEGPPDYVSDISVVDEPTAAPPPKEPRHAVYYRPGDIIGTGYYQTLKECWQARQQAGDVGVCVWK
jgi:hypothetical protein